MRGPPGPPGAPGRDVSTTDNHCKSCFSNNENIINLVVRRLNAYVGKERIHCFPVVRPVAMTQMQLAWWSGDLLLFIS